MSTDFLSPGQAPGGAQTITAGSERMPWFLGIVSIVVLVIPSSHTLRALGKPAEFLAFGLLLLALLHFVLLRTPAMKGLANAGTVAAFIYLAMGVALWAIGPAETSLHSLLSQTEAAGVALYAIARVSTHRQRSVVMGCVLIGMTYSAAVGLLQHFTQSDLTKLLKLPGFTDYRPPTAQSASVEVLRAGAVRAFGTFPGYGMFAVSCAVSVPLALHFARYSSTRSARILAGLAAAMLFAAAPTGVARAGVLALAVALAVYAWTFTPRQLVRAALFLSVAVIVLLTVATTTVTALVQTTKGSEYDPSVLARVEQISLVEGVFRDNPFAGLGTGTWLSAKFPLYGPIDSQWLFAIADGGLLGLAALLLLAGTALAGIPRAIRMTDSRESRSLTYAMGALILGYLAASFSNDFLNVPQAAFLFFLIYGLLWGGVRAR